MGQFTDEAAALHNLGVLAQRWGIALDDPLLIDLRHRALTSYDGDLFLNNLERLVASHPDRFDSPQVPYFHGRSFEALTALLSSSIFIPKLMQRHPEYIDIVLGRPRPYPRQHRYEQRDFLRLESEMEGMDESDFMQLLRGYRNQKMIEIALRELQGADSLEVLLGDISMLAEITLELAYRYGWKSLVALYGEPHYLDYHGKSFPASFAVIGLGKLGGTELNYSSDVDIIYLYDSCYQGTTTGGKRKPIETHQFFVNLSKLITRYLGNVTEDGFVFRVDLRLRPDGDTGEICLGLQSYENYYGTIGQTWERSMLIKARCVAGCDQLVTQFRTMVRPFVFRKYMDESSILAIRELKEKIDTKVRKNLHTNVKLGRGGIREIEFFLSIIQLLYGGKEPRLRHHSTLRCLDIFTELHYIERHEADELWQCYEFLRRVEHRIQMHDQRQSHTLPDDEASQVRIARQMGFERLADFLAELQRIMERVHQRFATLFHSDDTNHEDTPLAQEIFSGNYSREELVPMLAAFGFDNPRQAANNVYSILERSLKINTESRRLREISGTLLEKLVASSDADMALTHFERFYHAAAGRGGVLKLIYDVPQALDIFMPVFSGSPYLSALINRHPEMVDILVSQQESSHLPTRQELEERIVKLTSRAASDMELLLDQLRYFKITEFVRIAFMELSGIIDVSASTAALSQLADVIVDRLYHALYAEMVIRYGEPRTESEAPCPFAIVGLGKLGGCELNYSSDLDLIFLYQGAGQTTGGTHGTLRNNEFFIRLVQRLINGLSVATTHGVCYKVDARLRPNGNSGSLVTPLDGFISYHTNAQAMTWEKQMLLKARFICGDATLYATFQNYRDEHVLLGAFGASQFREIYDMRLRIEQEKGKTREGFHDYKAGRGGLIDIEFLCQCEQLHGAGENPWLLEMTRTFEIIDALAALHVWEKADSDKIREHYHFFRSLENMLKIFQENTSSALAMNGAAHHALAARLGFGNNGGERFLKHYRTVTTETRACFEKYFVKLMEA